MMRKLPGRCLDAALYASGFAITWAFPVLFRVLVLFDVRSVSPDRHPEGP